jgi:hypothetical protein
VSGSGNGLPLVRDYPPPPWWASLPSSDVHSLLTVSSTLVFPPTHVVMTELLKTTFLVEEKAFCAALCLGEIGPNGDWNTLFGGTEWTGSLDSFPNWSGVVWTDPATGQQSVTHAYGGPQFEPGTYGDIAARTGLHDVHPFSQIQNGLYLAYKDFKTRSGSDLLVALQSNSLGSITLYLSATWPGGASSSFPSRYTAALSFFRSVSTTQTPAPIPDPIPIPLPPTPVPIPSPIPIPSSSIIDIDITLSGKIMVSDLALLLEKIS